MKQSETKKDIMARSEHNAELARAFAASDKPKGASLTELINAYSREFDIEPAFVEKDVYVAKVLNVISGINYPDLKIVFSGGTCLSKAYNKIQRFSEDIDFRIHTDKNFTRSERKDFCDFILDKLNNIQDCKIVEISIKKGNENKFLSFEMGYKPLIFEEFIEPKIKMMVPRMHLTNLRPNIKVEFTFENLILPAKKCEIKSFLSEYIESEMR